ncbi:MAG: hypothetical protein ACFFAS_16500 [Promethearchaeota archaeon]
MSLTIIITLFFTMLFFEEFAILMDITYSVIINMLVVTYILLMIARSNIFNKISVKYLLIFLPAVLIVLLSLGYIWSIENSIPAIQNLWGNTLLSVVIIYVWIIIMVILKYKCNTNANTNLMANPQV